MGTSDFPLRPHHQTQDKPSFSQNGSSVTALTLAEEEDISVMLSELERWAPILGRLRKEQVGKLVALLDEKIERLMTWGLMGTEEQRFRILDRLTKLQEGPMATTNLDWAIEQQLNALCNSKKLPDEDGETGDSAIDSDGEWFSNSGSEVLVPPACRFPLAEAQVYKSDDSCYPLKGMHALLIERNLYTLEERSKEEHATRLTFSKKNVMSINLMKEFDMVIARLDDGESWSFKFNNTTDAMTVAFYLVIPAWLENS